MPGRNGHAVLDIVFVDQQQVLVGTRLLAAVMRLWRGGSTYKIKYQPRWLKEMVHREDTPPYHPPPHKNYTVGDLCTVPPGCNLGRRAPVASLGRTHAGTFPHALPRGRPDRRARWTPYQCTHYRPGLGRWGKEP